MANFTPGPWRVGGTWPNEGVTAVYDPDCVCVAIAWSSPQGPPPTEKQQAANARLIAAAPDLLAALKQLTRFCCRPGDDDRHDDGYDVGRQMANDAIAKAEGK